MTTAKDLPRRATPTLGAQPPRGQVLTLDWTRCAGHGVCAAALGERIDLDRWGYPTGVTTRGVDVPGDLVDAARLAVRSCPAAALRIQRADTQ